MYTYLYRIVLIWNSFFESKSSNKIFLLPCAVVVLGTSGFEVVTVSLVVLSFTVVAIVTTVGFVLLRVTRFGDVTFDGLLVVAWFGFGRVGWAVTSFVDFVVGNTQPASANKTYKKSLHVFNLVFKLELFAFLLYAS